jgi:pterin-4a-carbinolamine dehydratase
MSIALLNMVSKISNDRKLQMEGKQFGNLLESVEPDNFLENEDLNVPITPEQSNWHILDDGSGEYMSRDYVFGRAKPLMYFLAQIISHQEKINHHSRITIDELEVNLVLQTKDIMDVTELDIELAEFCDEIYEETRYYESE